MGASVLRVLEAGRPPAAPSPLAFWAPGLCSSILQKLPGPPKAKQLLRPWAVCSIWMRELMVLMILERRRGSPPAFQNQEPEEEASVLRSTLGQGELTVSLTGVHRPPYEQISHLSFPSLLDKTLPGCAVVFFLPVSL